MFCKLLVTEFVLLIFAGFKPAILSKTAFLQVFKEDFAEIALYLKLFDVLIIIINISLISFDVFKFLKQFFF